MAKPTVDFAALTRNEQLGGEGCATRVRFHDGPAGLHVFKGMDFRTYLTHCDDEGDKTVRHTIDCRPNSEALLFKIPPHPSIRPAPSVFVTAPGGHAGRCTPSATPLQLVPTLRPRAFKTWLAAAPVPRKLIHAENPDFGRGVFTITRPNGDGTPVVCGSLQPFYSHGDAGGAIEESNKSGQKIPPELKAKWCGDMAEAVAYTHRVAKTYHMDIKPGNFLIADGEKRLVLCDREQPTPPGPGAGRGLQPWEDDVDAPSTPDMDFDVVEHPNDLVTDWEGTEDIPESWKQMVDRCLSPDPNERPDVVEVVCFFKPRGLLRED
ncbi:hypothetical protein MAPG_10909 [Magnaporthiopsis poae ATCC 64411]|uniref:Protein kinase domain-containing protein n=1 Tax=Magnaporthiopsis poae (strain ATCC 64411 / 73-15) TaxID=644358 RepID=A0A0C4EDU8_MAGP6|nr:hypothetical protein MAPG_10909 [Magnaporthiopsis poae ATCC 64411]